jgi:hypothetical protein
MPAADPAPLRVHALRAGAVLCGTLKGAPVDWPPGNTWVPAFDERSCKVVNCEGCAAELARTGGYRR